MPRFYTFAMLFVVHDPSAVGLRFDAVNESIIDEMADLITEPCTWVQCVALDLTQMDQDEPAVSTGYYNPHDKSTGSFTCDAKKCHSLYQGAGVIRSNQHGCTSATCKVCDIARKTNAPGCSNCTDTGTDCSQTCIKQECHCIAGCNGDKPKQPDPLPQPDPAQEKKHKQAKSYLLAGASPDYDSQGQKIVTNTDFNSEAQAKDLEKILARNKESEGNTEKNKCTKQKCVACVIHNKTKEDGCICADGCVGDNVKP